MTYGTAELQGFAFEEKSCIPEDENKKNITGHCSRVTFLALYEAKGLENGTDGILGLSPDKGAVENKKFHYLRTLKSSKLIDKSIVSFNIALKK